MTEVLFCAPGVVTLSNGNFVVPSTSRSSDDWHKNEVVMRSTSYIIFVLALIFSFNAEAQGFPKMEVRGNNVVINNGSTIPTTANNTDFGTVVSDDGEGGVGVSTRRFVIRNIGTAPLKFRCGDPLGEEPEECEEPYPVVQFDNLQGFSVGFQPFVSGGLSIPVNGSATVVLRFRAGGLGITRATAGIFNNDPINRRMFFAVQGNTINAPIGPQPRIQASGNGNVIPFNSCCPRPFDHTDFGSGINSGVRTFTIRNTGNSNLNIASPQVLIPTGPSVFTVVTQPAASISPNTSTQFTVSYSGNLSQSLATIVIDNDDAGRDPNC